MDTIVEVYQDSIEGICFGWNDDHDYCTNGSLRLITFDAVDTEKYTVLVTGYDGSEEKFTLLVECDQRSLEPSKEIS